MGKITIEELLPKADNSVYKLVRLASNRALELADGKPCLLENPSTDKLATLALQEIAQGKIETKEAADAQSKSAKKKSGKA